MIRRLSILAALLVALPAPAAELHLPKILATPSETVTANMTITNVGSLAVESLDIIVDYDPSVLTFVAVRNGSGLMGGPHPPTTPIANDLGGSVRISGTTLLVGVVPPEDGTLVEIDFQALPGAIPGTTTLQPIPEVRINEIDFYSSTGPPLNATEGNVVIVASHPPGIFDMTVDRLDPTGIDMQLLWDDSCTGDLTHHLYYGFGSQFPASLGDVYSFDATICSIGATSPFSWISTPDPTTDASRLLWWLLVAGDDVINEGPWGVDGNGSERRGPGCFTASEECSVTVKDLSNSCTP